MQEDLLLLWVAISGGNSDEKGVAVVRWLPWPFPDAAAANSFPNNTASISRLPFQTEAQKHFRNHLCLPCQIGTVESLSPLDWATPGSTASPVRSSYYFQLLRRTASPHKLCLALPAHDLSTQEVEAGESEGPGHLQLLEASWPW